MNMKFISFVLFGVLSLAVATACSSQNQSETMNDKQHQHFLAQLTYHSIMADISKNDKIELSEEEWKERLTSDEYRILRKKGTEIPWANEYNSYYEEGVYVCRACGNPLFHSDTKYNSKSGWPSYWKPIKEDAVAELEDNSMFMTRTEIICNRCDSHIGHVFDDGPEPTGLRYCMNSKAMKFIPKEDSE